MPTFPDGRCFTNSEIKPTISVEIPALVKRIDVRNDDISGLKGNILEMQLRPTRKTRRLLERQRILTL